MNSVIRKTLQSFTLIALAAGICLPAAAQETATPQPAPREAKAKAGKASKRPARSNRKAPVVGKISLNGASVQELGEKIFERVLEIASGKKSKSEEWGYGHLEFAPWIIGATM